MSATVRTVGKAARAAGLSAKAVRLYEAKGLLPAADRTDAGYRLYSDDDVEVLRFIRQAKTLGLSLSEIRDILGIRHGGTSPCAHVLGLLDERIRDIDRTISELRQLRRTLASTRQAAARHPATCHDRVCGIIEHASDTRPGKATPS